jgi:8-oxo-dGTP pyrophosphatase MutT (NUDIX family)
LITHDCAVLIGQKAREPGHPISGEWHLLGGHVAHDEDVETAMRREAAEETGLTVSVESLVDVMTFEWGGDGVKDSLQILYHCEADSRQATAQDDLQAVRWVDPSELTDYLFTEEAERVRTRPRQAAFVEGLQ